MEERTSGGIQFLSISGIYPRQASYKSRKIDEQLVIGQVTNLL